MPIKTKKKYSKFRTKVLRILLLIGVAPLLIISLVSLFTVIKTRLGNISELQSQVIKGTSERIERYLDQKISVFNLVIDINPDNVAEIDIERLEFIGQELKKAAGNVNEFSFIDKYGKEIIRILENKEAGAASLKDMAKEEGFQIAMSGENYFGPIDHTLIGPVMQMASQVENKDRQIIGVIWVEVDLRPIEQAVAQVRIGNQGFVYVVDKSGSLIASSNKDFALKGENLNHILLVQDVINGNVHNGLSKQDRYTNPLGQKVIFSGRPMEMVEWYVISEWPWEDAFSVIWTMIAQFLSIIALSLILIIGFSLFFARLVVRPIETLSQGADEITKGNLDQKISIRTGDELQKLGERFNKMISVLKENEELRDEFVFIAAHELRAPTTVIKAYLSMVLKGNFGKINKKTRGALEISQELNERLIKLVHDLLEVARSEAGKMEIEAKPTLIQENIRTILKQFEKPAALKGIELIYEDLGQEIQVQADPYRLQQVVSNLVDNAIKYTTEGKGEIIISHEKQTDYLITHIKDSGIGIAEQDLQKMFTKFYRVKARETREVQGTGLGLFICKEIIERMKGKIWAGSQPGKGSTFSFSLPLV